MLNNFLCFLLALLRAEPARRGRAGGGGAPMRARGAAAAAVKAQPGGGREPRHGVGS